MTEKKMIFDQNSIEWLQFHSIDIRYYTYQSYFHKLKRLNLDFKGRSIDSITTFELQKYINNLYLVDDFKKSTIEKYKITLYQVFDYAIYKGLLRVNPCKPVKIPKKDGTKTRECISEYDIKIICDNIDNHQLGLYAYMMLFLGLRRSELLPLRWEDINFIKKEVKINKVVVFKGNTPTIFPKLKNGDSERVLPMTDNLYDILLKYKKSKGLIFSDNSELYKCSTIDRLWKHYKNFVDIEMSQHMLRHTYATMLYNAGVDIKTAQYLMGHRDITTLLKIYTHLEEKKKSKNISQLNSYINSNF